MAHFDADELLDYIRHEVVVEDDAEFCTHIVAPARRRAKHGGLPLNFRKPSEVPQEESRNLEIAECDEVERTSDVIEGRLRSRTVDSDKHEDFFNAGSVSTPDDELFAPHSLPKLPKALSSAISKNVSENVTKLQNPFAQFAQFESLQSRRPLLIFLPSTSVEPSMEVYVNPKTNISQLIGFILYKYCFAHDHCLNESKSSDDFQLYMCEDTGEVELDFPPFDGHRPVGDMGLTTMALVPKRLGRREYAAKHRIEVHFVTREVFVFELENLDKTLEWLRDEALRRRDECHHGSAADSAMFEYNLETADGYDKPLNLSQPIGSVGYKTFVMVRKSSSRGDYHPTGAVFKRSISTVLSPALTRPSSGIFDFVPEEEEPRARSLTESPIEEGLAFSVERLHKFKPSFEAQLVFHAMGLEIMPAAAKRRMRFARLPHKRNVIPWEHLCDVTVFEKVNGSSRSAVITLKYLPVLPENVVFAVTEGQLINLRHIAQLYAHEDWKTIQLELSSYEQAIEARSRMMQIIQEVASPILEAYLNSASGSRRPHVAAESVLMQKLDGPLLPPSPAPNKANPFTFKHFRRLSRAFTQGD